MADIAFRRATLTDVEAVSTLLRAAYRPYRDSGIALPPVEDGAADDIEKRDAWVVLLDERIIGFVVLSSGDPAHLMNLAVSPNASGRGFGARLLRFAEERAAETGAKSMALTTHADMQATQAWYRSKGWNESGREGQKVYFTKHIAKEGS